MASVKSGEGLKVTVPKNCLVSAADKDTRMFFSILQTTSTFEDLTKTAKARFRPMSKFTDMLQTYLSVVSDRLEELYPEASDDDFRGAVDWTVLQGHDMIQALLDVDGAEAFKQDARFWAVPGQQLHTARGHWMWNPQEKEQ
jgi:hypothetical protein